MSLKVLGKSLLESSVFVLTLNVCIGLSDKIYYATRNEYNTPEAIRYATRRHNEIRGMEYLTMLTSKIVADQYLSDLKDEE